IKQLVGCRDAHTPSGRPLKNGLACCSTEAKNEFMSTSMIRGKRSANPNPAPTGLKFRSKRFLGGVYLVYPAIFMRFNYSTYDSKSVQTKLSELNCSLK